MSATDGKQLERRLKRISSHGDARELETTTYLVFLQGFWSAHYQIS